MKSLKEIKPKESKYIYILKEIYYDYDNDCYPYRRPDGDPGWSNKAYSKREKAEEAYKRATVNTVKESYYVNHRRINDCDYHGAHHFEFNKYADLWGDQPKKLAEYLVSIGGIGDEEKEEFWLPVDVKDEQILAVLELCNIEFYEVVAVAIDED